MRPLRIGIDMGGTKIEIIALGPNGEELARERTATPRGDYPGTIQAIKDLVDGVEAKLDQHCSVGVGIPGAISPATGLIKNANSTWLIGETFDKDLGLALDRPVRMANDADCFALSEATDGAGAGKSVVFGVILGTGVGGGIVVHGRLLSGPNAIAGEWGHNALPWPEDHERPGQMCYCGKKGCIETFLSGPGLARDHELVTGKALSPQDITSANTPEKEASLQRYERRLAKALASVINIIDPGIIILGGGLSNLDRLYETVPKLLPEYVFSDRVDTQLKQHRFGDSSGVRGAAWLNPET